MFGYVQANRNELSQKEKERYQSVYCGLCHTLGKRYGFYTRLSLNFDLTFLALILSSLYEPSEGCETRHCIVHPCRKHVYVSNPCIDYAADMTVALMYFKCIDDWKDEHKVPQKCYATLLSKDYQRVKELHPGQCSVIEKELDEISRLEKDKVPSPDAAANSFGRLMAGVMVMKNDYWAEYLWKFGYSLGKYIYLADAAVDLKNDIKKGNYNPLSFLSENTEDVEITLKIILGDASETFELLPLVQDINILRNILYSGIWMKYNQSIQKERKRAEYDQ